MNNVIKQMLLKYDINNINDEINALKELLINKFKEINYNDAKEDVMPFIKNIDSLNLWNEDFFTSITKNLK